MPKKLIVCADGNWNTEDKTDQGLPCATNVVRVARSLKPADRQGIAQALHLRPDPLAAAHDSYGPVYKIPDRITGQAGGVLRQFRQQPAAAATAEDIHASVLERFTGQPDEKWPDSFRHEIKQRLGLS